MVDYKNEIERMKEYVEQQKAAFKALFWKPKEGQYRIQALGEIEEAKPFEQEGKEPQERRSLRIFINNEDQDYIWTFPYGVTLASTYGQLVHLGSSRGQLKGETFTVVVNGEGKNKRFTVVL